MKAELLAECELFVRNREVLKDTFRWDGDAAHIMGSMILTCANISPDPDKLKSYEKMIKSNVSILSSLRGDLRVAAVCNMCLTEDPEDYLLNVVRAYNLIRIIRHSRDERYYLAALFMCRAISDKEELLDLVDLANEIYDGMKRSGDIKGPMTGYPLAAAAAAFVKLSGREKEALISETEKCLRFLEPLFPESVTVDQLAVMLALDPTDAAFKCARIRELYNMFEEAGISYPAGDELPVLASFVDLDMTNAEITSEMTDADEYLRACKGMGMFGSGNAKRHMYAAMLLSHDESACVAGEAAILESMLQAHFAV